MLYKGLVRPHLEYASSVWARHKAKNIIELEKVQRRATKQLPGMRDMEYTDRLKEIKSAHTKISKVKRRYDRNI